MQRDVQQLGAGGQLVADLLHDEVGKLLHPARSAAHADKLTRERRRKIQWAIRVNATVLLGEICIYENLLIISALFATEYRNQQKLTSTY